MAGACEEQPTPVSSDPFEDAAPELQTFALAVEKDEEDEKQDKLTAMRSGKKVPIHEKCRICLCGIEVAHLIAPCECTGSMQYVHQDCLIKWLNTSFKGRCEVCFYQFKIRRNKVKLKNWKMLPMTSTQKAKYSIILSLHIIVFIFFLWSDYTLISQCINADKTTTNYWVKAAIVVVATITFIGFVIHQSRIYVRLFERWSVFNMKITNVFGKEEDVSRFSRRDDLSMSSGMYDQNSTGSIGRFFDMQ